MRGLFFSSLSEQIGFTLLHSLWQGVIGVVIMMVISRIVPAKHATIRYWMFVTVMLTVFVANIFTFSSQIRGSNATTEMLPPIGLTESLISEKLTTTTASFSSIKEYWSGNIQQVMPYFVMLWWFGIMALFIRLSINLWHVRQLKSLNHLPVSTAVKELFEQLKRRLNMNRIVKLVQSKQVLVPSVIGHFKPIILLPIGLVNGLSNDQVEAILLHELSHIKRHDFVINLVQSLVEVLYFFNPFMWIISNAIRAEREHACDDTAIALGIPKSVYAQTLAGVFNYATKRQQFTLSFASKNKLTLKRIQRIMKNQSTSNNKLMASMIFVIAITLSMYYTAQSHAPGQDMLEMMPDRTVMAMAIPPFAELSSPLTKPVNEKAVIEKFVQPVTRVVSDTTDPKELKKKAAEYDRAIEELKASKEWQEVEELRKDMLKESMVIMEDLGPVIEDALRLAEETMELKQVEMIELEKQLAIISEVMENLPLDEELQRVYEMNSRAMEESMFKMQETLADMDFEMMENLAQVYAEEAKQYANEAQVMAKEAEKMAAEANKYVEAVENFFAELKPLLIKDGYIKSADDLDQLKLKDGEVFVNGEKVKAKDAKKYIKIHDKYFAADDDFIMN